MGRIVKQQSLTTFELKLKGMGNEELVINLPSFFFLLPTSIGLKSVTSVTSVTESAAELPSSFFLLPSSFLIYRIF